VQVLRAIDPLEQALLRELVAGRHWRVAVGDGDRVTRSGCRRSW
jgi:hypothetical protein